MTSGMPSHAKRVRETSSIIIERSPWVMLVRSGSGGLAFEIGAGLGPDALFHRILAFVPAAEIGALDAFVGQEVFSAARDHDIAGLDRIGAVGDVEGQPRVLLGEEDRGAVG